MRDILKRYQPTRLEDLTALNALYRPGPIQGGMIDDFIARKHGKKKVTYDLPDLESILSETWGVILYQEQVMQIANRLAGFCWVTRICFVGPWAKRNTKRWPPNAKNS